MTHLLDTDTWAELRRSSKVSFLALLLAMVSGCTLYRHTDYVLRFSNTRTGAPPERRQLEMVFAHELFPLNAPRTIHTNLDDQGSVTLRLPDHSPTWVLLQETNGGAAYVFDLDLHSLQRDPRSSFTSSDKHTRQCQLVLTRSGKVKK